MTLTDFDYPRTIERIRVTRGYTDQTTGDYVPSTESTITIKGHVQDLSARELQQLPEGEYSIGDKKLYTSDDVIVGDRIKLTEPDGTVSEWEVRAQQKEYNILSMLGSRKSFLLKRKL